MKVLRIASLIISIILVAAGDWTPTQAQSNESPPYIMYFDVRDNGPQFIIERGDGADSRAFGVGMMDVETNVVDGPGWSSSREWFAWTSYTYEKFGSLFRQPHILHVDGDRTIALPDDVFDAHLTWSPDRDILAAWVVRTDADVATIGGSDGATMIDVSLELLLVDMASEEISTLASQPMTMLVDQLVEYRGFFNDNYIIWQGDYVLAWTDIVADSPLRYVVYDVTTGQETFNSDSLTVDPFRQGPLFANSANNAVIFEQTDTGGTVISLFDGTQRDINTGEAGFLFRLSPDGSRVWFEGATGSWFADLTVDPIQPIQLGGFLLPPPFNTSEEFPEVGRVWSPDSSAVIFERDGLPVIYTPADDTVMSLAIPSDARFVQWTGSETLVFERDGESNTELIFLDVTTNTPYTAAPRTNPPQPLIANAAGDVFVSHFAVYNRYRIMSDGTVSGDTLPPDARSYFAFSTSRLEAHPTENYFLAEEGALIAGGGDPRYYGIHSFDGRLDRELGYCKTQGDTCAFWLPESVDVSRLPAGEAAPDYEPDALLTRTLHGYSASVDTYDYDASEGWVYFIGWTPDGASIYAGAAPRDLSTILQYDANLERLDTAPVEVDGWEEIASISSTGDLVISPIEDDGIIVYESTDGLWQVNDVSELIETSTGAVIHRFKTDNFPGSVSQSPDGRYLAMSGEIFDLELGQVAATIPGKGVTSMAFSPDGTQLAVGRGWYIEIWDVGRLLGGQ